MANNPTSATRSMEITLIIENQPMKCSRLELTTNSDYFKAMLEGDFVESTKSTIKMEDVNFIVMENIMSMVRQEDHQLEDDIILSVIETCCMLQFLKVKELSVKQSFKLLTPNNCLSMWMFGEQFLLTELVKRTKLLALMEFETIRSLYSVTELDFRKVCLYLGNINLHCNSELQVFDAVMTWCSHHKQHDATTILKLLHCIDFSKVDDYGINSILVPIIYANQTEIVGILRSVRAVVRGSMLNGYPENWIHTARSLLNCRRRNYYGYPCILVNNFGQNKAETRKIRNQVTAMYYDLNLKQMMKLMTIKTDKNPKHLMVHVVGFKHYVYNFVTEVVNPNITNMRIRRYDLIKETWDDGSCIPGDRDIMDICISGDRLFVISSINELYVKCITWYNLKTDKWMGEVELPFNYLKCCDFNGQLFLLDKNKGGYFLISCTEDIWLWHRCHLIIFHVSVLEIHEVFAYGGRIFMKGKNLYEFNICGPYLLLNRTSPITYEEGYCEAKYVLCEDMLYSTYAKFDRDLNKFIVKMESFNVKTRETTVIFKKSFKEVLETNEGIVYKIQETN